MIRNALWRWMEDSKLVWITFCVPGYASRQRPREECHNRRVSTTSKAHDTLYINLAPYKSTSGSWRQFFVPCESGTKLSGAENKYKRMGHMGHGSLQTTNLRRITTIKHAIKHKTSLQDLHNCCTTVTALNSSPLRYDVIGCKLKQNANERCNSCASLAGLVLIFIACFIFTHGRSFTFWLPNDFLTLKFNTCQR